MNLSPCRLREAGWLRAHGDGGDGGGGLEGLLARGVEGGRGCVAGGEGIWWWRWWGWADAAVDSAAGLT